MNDLKIGIIGLGLVGNAIHQFCQKHKLFVTTYDKFKEINSLSDCLKSDILFLCLPTPFNSEISSFDLQYLNEVCKQLSDSNYLSIVVVK